MTDQQNKALYIAEQCRRAGLTLAGAAGVVANVEAESAFKSNNLQDCYNSSLGVSDENYTAQVDAGSRSFIDSAGYGLAQWTSGDRKKGLLAYVRARGKSIGDFQAQVDYLMYEMGNGYKKAWITCTNSNDPFECGYAVCKYYEIPADTENQANYRGSLARTWYNWLSANSGESSSIPDSSTVTPPAEGSDGTKDEDGIEIPTTWPPRTIDKEHCSGWPEIRLMQTALICRGYNALDNGIFDKAAEDKLKAFQKDSGLQEDGVCGPLTWAALLRL